MNYVEYVLVEKFGLSLTRSQIKEATEITLSYVFKFLSASQYSKKLKALLSEDRVIEIRNYFLHDGYLLKNIKPWLYHVYYYNAFRKDREKIRKAFNVDIEDEPLINVVKNMKGMNTLINKKYPPLSLKDIDSVIVYALKKSDVFTKKFVFRKMAFIVRTQGIEFGDLINEVKEAAIHSVLFTYPRFKTFDHCLNTVKRTIHNKGVNLLEFYSGDSRSRLMQTSEGMISKNVPMSYAITDESYNDFLECNLQNNETNIDDVMSIQSLLRTYTGRRQQFLSLLVEYNEDFTEYLHNKKITKKTNDDYRESCSDLKQYIKHCLDYLGVSEKKGNSYINNIRKQIG